MPRSLGVLGSILCLWLLSQSPTIEANDLIERFAADAGDAMLETPKSRRVILTESDAFLTQYLKNK